MSTSSSESHAYTTKLLTDTADTPRAQGAILPIPKEIAKAIPTRPDRTRRVNVYIGSLEVYQAKIAGNGRGGYFVPVNRQRREYLEERFGIGAKLTISLTPDTSAYGLPVPEVFALLLEGDSLAKAYFDDMAGGLQRRILFGLAAPKRESTQLHRAVATAEYIVEVRGEVDLKELANRWRLPQANV